MPARTIGRLPGGIYLPPLPDKVRRRLLDIVTAALWLPLAYSAWASWAERRAPLALPLLGMNLLIIALFALRRPSRDTARSPLPWILGGLGTAAPLLMRAVVGPIGPVQLASLGLQAVAIAGMLTSLACLGRSFGVVPAHRGLVKSGPYGIVRHPLYSFEIAFYSAFLLGNFTWRNVVLLAVCAVIQMLRARAEEHLLVRDLRYRDYRRQVPFRFIPHLL